MPKISTYTNVGNIATGDKLLGERVDDTTVRFTYVQPTMNGTTNRLTVTSGTDTFTYDISANYVGQNTITTVGTIATGTWNGSVISVLYGGSGVASHTAYGLIAGGTTATGAEQTITPGAANTFLLSSGASALPVWSTSTIPASAGATANKVLLSDGTNYVLSTPTFPNAASTSGKLIKSNGTNFITTTTTYPDTGTSGKILRGNGTNYAESTSTFADTYTASNILYSNGSNTVTGLATANNGVLVTSGTGVPSISTDIPTAVTQGGQYSYRAGGTDVPVTDGGTGVSTMTTAYAPICAGTTATGALQVASTGLSTSGYVLTSNGASAVPSFQAAAAAAGTIVQNLETTYATYANTSASIPWDNSIPQNTEGTEYITLAITPQSASNILEIETNMQVYVATAGNVVIAALFQDSTANALAARDMAAVGSISLGPLYFSYRMTAGTTSSTTFKVRVGVTGGSVYINGSNTERKLGGVAVSYLRIKEIKV